MPKHVCVLLFLLILSMTGCDFNDVDQRKDAYLNPDLSGTIYYLVPQEIKKWLIDHPGTVLVDVRTPEEYRNGHITGAVNVDVDASDFDDRVKNLVPTQSYLLYCRTGVRTETAKKIFQRNHFQQIAILEGGIQAWLEAGFPL